MFGISGKSLEMIISVLESFPQVEKGLIFGSRAMADNKRGSDIDIALEGSRINWDISTKISGKLNESVPIPYQVDVVDFTHLDNPELKKHIEEHGKVFYDKKESVKR
jgi:predicted nucleotidyltransferase